MSLYLVLLRGLWKMNLIKFRGAAQATTNASPRSAVPGEPPQKIQELSAEDHDDLEQTKTFEGHIEQTRLQEVPPRTLSYLKDHPNSWTAYYQLWYIQCRTHNISGSITAPAKSLELNVKH